MGATNTGEEKAPPATDDLEKQKLETNPVTPTDPSNDEKAPLKKNKGKGQGKSKGRPITKAEQTTGFVILGLFVFLVLFALITWLALRPVHRPRYFMNNVQIKSLAVNTTGSTVDADFL